MVVGSLFAGIGGFDLGFERAGMRTAWQVEIDPFCRAVLAKHFPEAEQHEDVCEVGAHNLAPVDLICGGFPCQDLSYAGRGAGIDGSRSGLWSEYARIIGELRPRFVVVENVPALLRRGLGRVLGDLAALGYDAEWDCLPACAFGAPHRRDRVWLVAYPERGGFVGPDSHVREHAAAGGSERSGAVVPRFLSEADGGSALLADAGGEGHGALARGPLGDEEEHEGRAAERADLPLGRGEGSGAGVVGGARPEAAGGALVPDANGQGSQRHGSKHRLRGDRGEEPTGGSGGGGRAGDAPDADEQRREGGAGDLGERGWREPSDGRWWLAEPELGRVAHGVPYRVDRLSALGNALVPQIAEWIGRRLIEVDR